MIIQAQDREFEIIQRLSDNAGSCVYIGTDSKDMPTQRLYFVTAFSDTGMIRRNLPIFTALRQNQAATDFVDCFSKKGTLYVVFHYYQEQRLEYMLATQEIRLLDRLKMMKSLLEKMLISQLPDTLLCEVLRSENLLLSVSLEPFFQYRFDHPERLSEGSYADVCKRLQEIAELVFVREFKNRSMPYLQSFFHHVAQKKFTSSKEIYKTYLDLVKRVEEMDEESLQHISIWNRMRLATHGITSKLKLILSLLVISGALLGLLFYPANVEKKGVAFSSIGTMKLET